MPSSVSLKISSGLQPSDCSTHPVLFVGQIAHLSAISYEDVRCKVQPYVTEECWKRAIKTLTASPGDSCELWPRGVTIASLPARRSRHAAPSRAHAVARAVKTAQRGGEESVVLICAKRDVLPSVCAVARSYPLYSRRTALTPGRSATLAPSVTQDVPATVSLEILLAEDCGDHDSDSESLSLEDPYLCDVTLTADDLRVLNAVAESVRLAARIADTPTNEMNVDHFVEEAKSVAAELSLPTPTIIRGEELRTRGLGGLYGVGRAAAVPPALVVLTHAPRGEGGAGVAWVGKGIVYDTGGLSIKSKTSMPGMKGDCAGAAAVLAAFRVAVLSGYSQNLHAVLCLAENSVGPNATRPDDIHTLYSGRTVEINNTDAEGRLVLSDGVVYAARDLSAETIVDVATLTGAQGTATGRYHAAVLSNRSRWERLAMSAGLRSADLTFPVPFAPELHFKEFASVVADMKNSVADRSNAQPSCAGLFILAHLGFDFPGAWLHVDMAAPAHCGERATGYGVALLSVLFGRYSRSRLLQALSPHEDISVDSPSGKKQRLQ